MALPELIANSTTPGTVVALTTLAKAANTGEGTIETNAAAPTALQGSGQFRIVVGSEVMLVTAGAATTVWTVTRAAEGSTEANHALSVSVFHYLTAGAILALLEGSMSWYGAWSSVPEYPKGAVTRSKGQTWVSAKPENKNHSPEIPIEKWNTEVLDSFKRAEENPLNNGEKWLALNIENITGHAGKVAEEVYKSVDSFEAGADAAFWQVKKLKGSGQASVTLTKLPGGEGRAVFLFVHVEHRAGDEGSTRSGYLVKFEEEGVTKKFKVIIKRFEKTSTLVTLQTTEKVQIEVNYELRFTVLEGKLQAWKRISSAESWKEIAAGVADANYTEGFVGLGAWGASSGMQNFEAGEHEVATEWWGQLDEQNSVGTVGAYESREANKAYEPAAKEATRVYLTIKGKAEATEFEILVDEKPVYKFAEETLVAGAVNENYLLQIKSGGIWEVKVTKGTLAELHSVYQAG